MFKMDIYVCVICIKVKLMILNNLAEGGGQKMKIGLVPGAQTWGIIQQHFGFG